MGLSRPVMGLLYLLPAFFKRRPPDYCDLSLKHMRSFMFIDNIKSYTIYNNNNNNNNNNIYCNWVVTRWQWLFNANAKHEIGLLLNLRLEGYMISI
jgi:hypothetical protein